MNGSTVYQNLITNNLHYIQFFSKLRNQNPLEADYKKFENFLLNGYSEQKASREMSTCSVPPTESESIWSEDHPSFSHGKQMPGKPKFVILKTCVILLLESMQVNYILSPCVRKCRLGYTPDGKLMLKRKDLFPFRIGDDALRTW